MGSQQKADNSPGGRKERIILFLRSEKGAAFILADFYLMGIIFHLIPAVRPFMEVLTPWFLFIAGAAVLLALRKKADRRALIWFVLVYLVTYILEVTGVKTGKVFGAYLYGDALGLKILEVPLVIGFNWSVIVLGFAAGVDRLLPRLRYLTPLLTGVGAVLFDYLMEPVAVHLGYWTWACGVIPLQNYIAWFVIAAVCGGLYLLFRVKIRSWLPLAYVGFQVVFFTVLRIVLV